MFDLSYSTPQICQTPICIQTAEAIKKDLNLNIDPCTDFYEYSCGGWISNHELPPDRSDTGILSDIQYNNEQIIYDIIRGTYDDFTRKVLDDAKPLLIEQDIDRSNFDTVQAYYNTCMDEDTLTQWGPSLVYPALAQFKKKTDLTDILTFSFIKGEEPLFSTFVGSDSKNPAVKVISIDQPGLVAPSKEYYKDKAVMEKYRLGLVSLLESIVGKKVNNKSIQESRRVKFALLTKAEIETSVKQFIEMETILAGLFMEEEVHSDAKVGYNPRSLAELQTAYPFVDWNKFFKQLIPNSIPMPSTVVVAAVPYFDGLSRWFKQSQDNNLDLLKNYFMVRYIYGKSSRLDPQSGYHKYAISRGIFSGVYTNPPRWRHCLSSTTETFGKILARYFVMVKFGGEGKRKRIYDFLTLIHHAWERRLKTLTWLDQPTLEMALDKISKITQLSSYGVGDPDTRSPSSLESHYRGLMVSSNIYFKNAERADLWCINKSWEELLKPLDKSKFDMDAMSVNAYYSPFENQIAVAAGIVSPPFYDDQVPDYLNFAGLGLVVGHEITHAFDKQGRLFNGDGKLDDWWTRATENQFNEKSKCFINQYYNFTITDSNQKIYHTNGNMTLNENLADNGGLAVAYDAYQQLTKTRPQQYLPNLDLTPDQLFFVNYGRAWCGKQTTAYNVNLILSDEHAIQKARINGVVQNLDSFAKHFKCPAQSPMNPSTKCSVW
ncbi:hypothetical protein BC941DRAFT_497247 [Chlamydoabsidia padenii]|nr:hypothetical protein BC941DRAFT_497247 [Chlamydoabsidia padenii]